MKSLFAYGTLMCEDIMKSVAGVAPQRQPGQLTGYARLCVKNEQYPGLIPQSDSIVEGVLYLDISQESWQRLDLFEGELYYRDIVEVTLENGKTIDACTYIVKEIHRHRLSERIWSFEEFLKRGKNAFVNSYTGYDDIE